MDSENVMERTRLQQLTSKAWTPLDIKEVGDDFNRDQGESRQTHTTTHMYIHNTHDNTCTHMQHKAQHNHTCTEITYNHTAHTCNTHAHTYTITRVHTQSHSTHEHTDVHTSTHVHTYNHTRTHNHTHECTHTCTHTAPQLSCCDFSSLFSYRYFYFKNRQNAHTWGQNGKQASSVLLLCP